MSRFLPAALLLLASWTAQAETDAEEVSDLDRPSMVCNRSVGVALGLIPTGRTWEFIGRGAIAVTGSPVFEQSCAYRPGGNAEVYAGLGFAPWERHIYFDGSYRPMYLMAIVGVGTSGDTWRAGLHLAGQPAFIGVGGQAQYLFHETKNGLKTGFTARVNVLAGRVVDIQTAVLYTFQPKAF